MLVAPGRLHDVDGRPRPEVHPQAHQLFSLSSASQRYPAALRRSPDAVRRGVYRSRTEVDVPISANSTMK